MNGSTILDYEPVLLQALADAGLQYMTVAEQPESNISAPLPGGGVGTLKLSNIILARTDRPDLTTRGR